MNWLNRILRKWTGAEADLERARRELADETRTAIRASNALSEATAECATLRSRIEAGDAERAQLNRRIAELTEEVRKLNVAESFARTLAQKAEAKLALAQHYLADMPAPSEADVTWTEDDRKTLAAFLENNPTGKKLAQHLANRLADYEKAAVLYRSAADMPALLKRAHGFRDCRGEIRRLSAAGPSPATHEQSDFPLPADLENLRG